jgi:hypothetical protein
LVLSVSTYDVLSFKIRCADFRDQNFAEKCATPSLIDFSSAPAPDGSAAATPLVLESQTGQAFKSDGTEPIETPLCAERGTVRLTAVLSLNCARLRCCG